jgi:hypothetical protein
MPNIGQRPRLAAGELPATNFSIRRLLTLDAVPSRSLTTATFRRGRRSRQGRVSLVLVFFDMLFFLEIDT